MRENLEKRIEAIAQNVARAAQMANRRADKIKIVAVSKTYPAETIQKAVEAGARIFGENKIQEAEEKITQIGRGNAEWHLIGHLQSNKARKAVKLFDVIHTIDSCELAERLERICFEENRERLSVLVQVDLGNEMTKNGIKEADLSKLVEFLKTCERVKFNGLMTIPPFFEDVEMVPPYFKKLRELRDEILPDGELSMGMSHDFAVAIEEGATIIRVGTAIFGEREKNLQG